MIQRLAGSAELSGPPESRQAGAAIHRDIPIDGCETHTFKVHPRTTKKKFPEYFMMSTVAYTSNSAGVARPGVEILDFVGEKRDKV